MTFLDNLKWRYAVKAFDSERKVSAEDMDKILESVHLAPTSFGLQPFHVIDIEDEDLQAKIREVGFNQSQMTDASHLLVFCARTDMGKRIDEYMEILSGGDAEKREKMKEMEGMIKGATEGMDEIHLEEWAKRQTYIALGFALAAAAELKIDSCPMEGFIPPKVDELLGLPAHMKSVVMIAVGYRSEDPRHPKVRFEKDELIQKKL